MTGDQNWIFILKTLFPQKLSDVSFTSPANIHGSAAIAKPLIIESNTQKRKRWCHGHETWSSDKWKRTRDMVRWVVLHAVPYMYIGKSLRLENTRGSLQSGMPVSAVKHGRYCDGLENSVGPTVTLHARITASEHVDRLGNQVHPTIQTLFPNSDAVFQDDSASIQTAGIVPSWFEEHKRGLQHLPWPAQPPDLNITEPFRSVLESIEWGTDPHLQHLNSKLKLLFKKNGTKFR
jgi:hypothetical protein